MGSRSTSKYIALLLGLLLIASLGGVFAVWFYANGTPSPRSDDVGITLAEFVYKPADILPEDESLGEDYIQLLESILNNGKIGLNSGKGDTLEAAVQKNEILHWDQNIQGGNLKFLKDFLVGGARELDYVMHYVSDTEFHVYKYENDDVDQGTPNVTRIKVYKTILIKEDGTWTGKESQLGYATLRYVPNSSHIGIIPTEWVRGNMPD